MAAANVEALVDAAYAGNVAKIVELLDAGVNVNGMHEFGYAALHVAATQRKVDVVKKLLERGANPNILNEDDSTPLIKAFDVDDNNDVILALLESPTIDITRKGYKKIPFIIRATDARVAKALLDKGANVNEKAPNGTFALLESVGTGIELTRLLLDRGADINMQDKDGVTTLMYAADYPEPDIVKLLLEKGADKTIRDNEGRIAFEYAKDDEVKELLKVEASRYTGKDLSDITIYDVFLGKTDEITTEEQAKSAIANNSLCPVCLSLEERGSEHGTGCMYKYHICKPELRHKELYNLYKDERGYIYWCTFCGRICDSHFHYKLALVTDPKPGTVLSKDKPGSFFALSCDNSTTEDIEGYNRVVDGVMVRTPPAKSNGGGGLGEKLKRIARLIDYSFELQHAVGEISNDQARKELIEEVWNAPMFRMRFNPMKWKKWKTDLSAFSAPSRPAEIPEAVPAAGDIEDPVVQEGEDFISLGDGIVIQFKHKDSKGEPNDHVYGDGAGAEKHFIGKDSLLTYLSTMGEAEGKCFDADECGGLLWPQEIAKAFEDPRLEVTGADKKVLAAYKEKFNRDRAPVAGGAKWRFNFISKMEDDMCMLPPKGALEELKGKKAGNRTRKNKKRAKKTRRNK